MCENTPLNSRFSGFALQQHSLPKFKNRQLSVQSDQQRLHCFGVAIFKFAFSHTANNKPNLFSERSVKKQGQTEWFPLIVQVALLALIGVVSCVCFRVPTAEEIAHCLSIVLKVSVELTIVRLLY